MASVTRVLRVRRAYAELGYCKDMPKSYVERMKRTIPRKIYDNRLGAPRIIHWLMPPSEYKDDVQKPWENEVLNKSNETAQEYQTDHYMDKVYRRRVPKPYISDEDRTFLVGDKVQVMVGMDRGKEGRVTEIIKERNWLLVMGLHRKLTENPERLQATGLPRFYLKEQPLDFANGQVKLIDPFTGETCDAEWVLNEQETDYIRVSRQSGAEIPIPYLADSTYEYATPETYTESKKDTPAKVALERTYKPTLSTFEQDILDRMKIEDEEEHQLRPPTYWY